MASVLAVVAGSPVQAANTSAEHLVDTNDDGTPDARKFAGSDRYDTALRLAKHFAHDDTAGSVSKVIVASGETQIDAVAAAGLAGYEEAPVLLTRHGQLPAAAARFIEHQGVSKVYVAGGTAVISDDVIEQIEGLKSKPTVQRVAGSNRFGTAAALASEIPSTATTRWCGSDDSAVFLANGNQVPITSAIVAGPMSYRMQMPLLLTAEDALPAETAEYIDDNDVDRVVIIGTADEVSVDVVDEVTALGASVDRVAGDDAASTSVEVAKLMWDDCDDLPTDRSHVVLVNVNATVDGVTGGPVAGRGIANNDMSMPILLVGDELPASVRDWLASTPEELGGNKTHLALVAIGGTAVVSNSVMAAAVDAANTGPGLETSITAENGRSLKASKTGRVVAVLADNGSTVITAGDPKTFLVNFSDEIALNEGANGLTDAAKRQLSDVLYVNGQLASIGDEIVDIRLAIAGDNTSPMCTPGASVKVTLTHPLKAGDKIEVRPNSYKFGKDKDQRLLKASSATVELAPNNAKPPTVEVIAIEGQGKVFLRSDGAPVADSTAGEVEVRSSVGAKFTVGAVAADDDIEGLFTASLTLTADLDLNGDGDTEDSGEAASGEAYILRRGDSAWAERNVFTKDKLPSRYHRDEVVSRVPSFSATSVQVGSRDTGVDDDPSNDAGKVDDHLVVPAVRRFHNAPEGTLLSQRASVFIGGAVPDSLVDTTTWVNQMQITGLWSGDAAGAAGNDWQITIDSNASYNAAAETPEIDVSVSNRTGVAGGGLIRVQFIAGKPTLGDLAAALNDHSDFADNFLLRYNCNERRDVIDRNAFHTTSTPLTNGVSTVAIQVNWNDWVYSLMNATSTEPSDTGALGTTTNDTALRDDVLSALVPGYGTSGTALYVNVYLIGGAPSMSARITFTTADATKLPGLRSGPKKGVVTFGGDYYPVWNRALNDEGVGEYTQASGSVRTRESVAVNYLFGASIGDSGTDVDKDTDKFGSDTSNDPEAVSRARSRRSEPYDPANREQTIRVSSGAVLSHTPFEGADS